MSTFLPYSIVFFALATGNFLWAAFQWTDVGLANACERTFFQLVAVVVCYFTFGRQGI